MIQPALSVLAAWLLAGTARPAEDAPQTLEVVRGSGLSLRLEVLPRASLASADWLALEFENTTDEAVTVADAHYRIEAERCNLRTGEQRGSGGLASGNTYDLFPEAWNTTPVSPIVLGPKVTHVADHPSDYASALLGLAPKEGWHVHARLHVRVDLRDGRHLETGIDGAPFEFDWLHPGDAGFAAMRNRLRGMLERPEKRVTHAYLLGTLLGLEAVSAAISRDDLLAALARRSSSFEGREAVAEHIAKRCAEDEVVIDLVRTGLKTGDPATSLDLVHAGLWDASFVEPMVRLYESTTARGWEVLNRLHAHHADWNDAGFPVRLSAAVRKHHPVLERNAIEVDGGELEAWAQGVQCLGMTGDHSMIALLRPALDDRRAFRTADSLSTGSLPLPPLRVCDCALDAILVLLDSDAQGAYAKAMSEANLRRDDASHAVLRDGMIRDLRHRLAEGNSKGK